MSTYDKKLLLGMAGLIALLVAALIVTFLYKTRWEVVTVDSKQSPDESHELLLQSVGEPYWPFGAAPGRLVLRDGDKVVSEVRIEIANDGAPFTKNAWRVMWHEDRVEITLSGGEQLDEYVTMCFDGEVFDRWEKSIIKHPVPAEPEENNPPIEEWTLSEEEQRIYDGYLAVYTWLAGEASVEFEVQYGAKESSTRCILKEDDTAVEYLVYDRQSKNGACGLYVHYRSEKDAKGTWYSSDAAILDIYAYAYECGAVVSSGKTNLGAPGSEVYKKTTGE